MASGSGNVATKSNQNQKNALVVRHNKLIESKHFLSLSERRFVLWIISQINRSDEDFRAYRIGVKEWREFVGLMPNEDLYSEIFKMADSLTKRNVGIKQDDGKSFSFIPWFHEISYKAGTGTVEAILHPKLKPFLLQLKEQYTAITLEYALLLRSGYAHRIYDLLKQYQWVGSRTILLADLREMMEVKRQEYPKFADFRKRVLEVARREINQKTDIAFDFEPVKEGRKTTAIFFRIRTTKPTVTLENPEETDEHARAAFQALVRHGIAEKTARALIADYDLERIKWHVAAYEKRKKDGKANGIGWLVDGIRSDYRPQVSIFEQEEEARRKQAQEERARQAALDAEIERLRRDCDEHNRKAGIALLEALPEAEREAMRSELLSRYGDSSFFGERLRREGVNNPSVLPMYLALIHEKHPEKVMGYLEYAKAHKASKEAIKALRNK